ncbi:MAG: ribose-phosphate diphosphokinase [Candidatus Berkiellales bacterium]
MNPIALYLFGATQFIQPLQNKLNIEIGEISFHYFPDKEVLVRIKSDVKDRHVILVANLLNINLNILPLIFTAETARELGAKHITLIAPYLPYMRQDKQFDSSEGVTSKYFGSLLSNHVDALITFDPHLHRWKSLSDIYTIPTVVLHATNNIALWIKEHIPNPFIIGPDMESEQWINRIAQKVDAPYIILEKTRKGDRDVEVMLPATQLHQNRTPVLIDDIISTGVTMTKSIEAIMKRGWGSPICIGIHAVFVGNAYQDLLNAGAKKIVTSNTLPHLTNEIDLNDNIIDGIAHI